LNAFNALQNSLYLKINVSAIVKADILRIIAILVKYAIEFVKTVLALIIINVLPAILVCFYREHNALSTV
jgi:hypothetical protein